MPSPLQANAPALSGKMLLFIAAHAPLALAMKHVPYLSTVHTIITAIVCLQVSMTAPTALPPALAIAYVAGAETLWRMTGSLAFWETGKYLCAVIAVLALVREVKAERPPSTNLILPYFLLLLPSIFKVLEDFSGAELRNALSFNLSGPFALAVLGVYFSRCIFDVHGMARLLGYFLAPLMGVSCVAFVSLATTGRIAYTDFESNFVAAGGFGPNQVASLFGLGALCCIVLYLVLRLYPQLRRGGVAGLLLLGAAGLAVQSAMTLSRGGVWALGVALACAVVFLLHDARVRMLVVVGVPLLYVLAVYVAVPIMDNFTGGRLVHRFTEKTSGGRDHIAQSDINLWRANFLLGAGPGAGAKYRERETGRKIAAHTEATRILGEHGAAGICALVALGVASAMGVLRARSPLERAVKTAFCAWTFLFMAGNAMRLMLPAFAFGLGMAGFALAARKR